MAGFSTRDGVRALLLIFLDLFLSGFIGCIAGVVIALTDAPADPITVLVIAMSAFFLWWCWMFRSVAQDAPFVPAAMFHFVDLSLALAAAAIAAIGLPGSAVRLGSVPPWLIAVGPPLLVATVILVANLLRHRPTTPRWGLCLLAATIAGLTAWPAKLALTKAFTAIPLPAWIDRLTT